MAFLLSKLDDNDPEVRESAFDIIRTFAKYGAPSHYLKTKVVIATHYRGLPP